MDFCDEYEHKIENVLYFPRSIPSREAEKLYPEVLSCDCRNECSIQNCGCFKNSGSVYKYENVLDIESYKLQEIKPELPLFECNMNCSCSKEICGNRLVQYGPRKGLMVKPCSNTHKGLGLFTTTSINAGNFVCEYAGEVLTETEAKTRFELYKELYKMNYILCVNEIFDRYKLKTFIDPTIYGNIGRYINHSCNPNCKLVIVKENNAMPIIAIFANKNLEPETEITYDYGEEQRDNSEHCSIKPCFCNESNCRKYLPLDLSLT
uniref:Probable histone-lysine N-methyltransferase set-23 n=1 Tax=Diabrotica virgifera virgifera TaxID=50390 RepID=A0A6P7FYP5_DIAVI